MKCPVCKNVSLLMAEKQGVEIDYCPECRGIWLDRNELEKIIEKTTGGSQERSDERKDKRREHRDYDDDRYYDKKGRPVKRRKRDSVFEEIFDIF